jgi:hypothetical protein
MTIVIKSLFIISPAFRMDPANQKRFHLAESFCSGNAGISKNLQKKWTDPFSGRLHLSQEPGKPDFNYRKGPSASKAKFKGKGS